MAESHSFRNLTSPQCFHKNLYNSVEDLPMYYTPTRDSNAYFQKYLFNRYFINLNPFYFSLTPIGLLSDASRTEC